MAQPAAVQHVPRTAEGNRSNRAADVLDEPVQGGSVLQPVHTLDDPAGARRRRQYAFQRPPHSSGSRDTVVEIRRFSHEQQVTVRRTQKRPDSRHLLETWSGRAAAAGHSPAVTVLGSPPWRRAKARAGVSSNGLSFFGMTGLPFMPPRPRRCSGLCAGAAPATCRGRASRGPRWAQSRGLANRRCGSAGTGRGVFPAAWRLHAGPRRAVQPRVRAPEGAPGKPFSTIPVALP